nr:MAG TPA: hypothetical protein [Caudoviricetes sp.]
MRHEGNAITAASCSEKLHSATRCANATTCGVR